MAAILNLSVTLTLNIKEYYHYLQEHMNSLSKGVILSILDTYNQIMRGKRHNFINFWHFFFFYMAAILYLYGTWSSYIFKASTQSGIIINPYINIFVTISPSRYEGIRDEMFSGV